MSTLGTETYAKMSGLLFWQNMLLCFAGILFVQFFLCLFLLNVLRWYMTHHFLDTCKRVFMRTGQLHGQEQN